MARQIKQTTTDHMCGWKLTAGPYIARLSTLKVAGSASRDAELGALAFCELDIVYMVAVQLEAMVAPMAGLVIDGIHG